MKVFLCRVSDASGKKSLLQRTGQNVDLVLRDLHQEGFFVLSIREGTLDEDESRVQLKAKTIIEFSQTLATLLANGLTLKETLEIAVHVFPSSDHQKIFRHVSNQVNKGDSLYDSLLYWKKSFPPLYLGLIRIGEKTGDLAKVLERLTDYLITRKTLKDKAGNALAYPLFVLAIAVLGLTALMAFVFPTLTSIVGSLNKNAAAVYAQNIHAFQVGMSVVAAFVAAGIACFVLIAFRSRKDPSFRVRVDRALLKIPLLRGFLFANFGLNLSFALETLLAAGYPLEEALIEGAQVVSNAHLKEKILRIREKIVKGQKFSQAAREEGGFPETFLGWIAVGEGSHDLLKSFAQLKRYYQDDLDKFNSRFLSLVEPSLIVAVGGMLLVMILTFITPVFTMMGNLL